LRVPTLDRSTVPASVRAINPVRLVAEIVDDRLLLFLREDEWGLRKYVGACPGELRLCVWDFEPVLAVVLLLRLARTDLTTFEYWIDAGSPAGVRILQGLAEQPRVDAHIVTAAVARSVRVQNTVRRAALDILDTIRQRRAWTPEDFAAARRRICQLYPTAAALWWSGASPGEK